MDELIEQTIPSEIRLNNQLNLDKALSEQEFLIHIKELRKKINNTKLTLV